MNRLDLIRLANECGIGDKDLSDDESVITDYGDVTAEVLRFAHAVAEADRTDQARLLGISGERECALLAQLAELRKLAEAVLGWKNCNQAWLDTSEDESAAVVGHITEDGETYPVAVIDCDQYYAGQDSLPLAKLYAAANPATILQLLDYIETLEKDAGRYRFIKSGSVDIDFDGESATITSAEKQWVVPPFAKFDAAIDAAMGETE